MSKSRREFLANMSIPLLAAAAFQAEPQQPKPAQPPAGAPPAFGTSPAVGPVVSSATFTEAEKLVQVEMTPHDLAEAASNWRNSMAALYERRTGPRKVSLDATFAPATQWNPVLPGMKFETVRRPIKISAAPSAAGAAPKNLEDVAFYSVRQLAELVRTKKVSSSALTEMYIARLKRYDPVLHCVITLTEERAMAQARDADREIATGKYRGPLHGLP